jgi:hypothetical protein
MTIQQIARLFRQFVDEPNKTFLTDDDVKLYLQIAYDQFREIAFQIDPKVFTETLANLPITTQNVIDLTQSPIVAGGSNSILGNLAYASGRTMLHITDVVQTQVLGDLTTIQAVLRAAGSYNDLYVPDLLAAPSYYLQGDFLYLSGVYSTAGNLTILGVKQQPVSLWSNLNAITPPDTTTINYHDLIALLAYRNYAVRDGALQQATEAQLAQRTNEFKEFIQFGRQMRANNRVLVEDHDVYYY